MQKKQKLFCSFSGFKISLEKEGGGNSLHCIALNRHPDIWDNIYWKYIKNSVHFTRVQKVKTIAGQFCVIYFTHCSCSKI